MNIDANKIKIYKREELPEQYHNYHAYKTDGFEWFVVNDSWMVVGEHTLDECVQELTKYIKNNLIDDYIYSKLKDTETEVIKSLTSTFGLSEKEAQDKFYGCMG